MSQAVLPADALRCQSSFASRMSLWRSDDRNLSDRMGSESALAVVLDSQSPVGVLCLSFWDGYSFSVSINGLSSR